MQQVHQWQLYGIHFLRKLDAKATDCAFSRIYALKMKFLSWFVLKFFDLLILSLLKGISDLVMFLRSPMCFCVSRLCPVSMLWLKPGKNKKASINKIFVSKLHFSELTMRVNTNIITKIIATTSSGDFDLFSVLFVSREINSVVDG